LNFTEQQANLRSRHKLHARGEGGEKKNRRTEDIIFEKEGLVRDEARGAVKDLPQNTRELGGKPGSVTGHLKNMSPFHEERGQAGTGQEKKKVDRCRREKRHNGSLQQKEKKSAK